MKKGFTRLCCGIYLCLCLCFCLRTSFAQQVQPTWASLNQRPYPQWFSDAKLGIFIHWGLYSVPAYTSLEGYGEWYYRGLMLGDTARINFQNRVFGQEGKPFEYRDFAPLWKAELFNANQWADPLNGPAPSMWSSLPNTTTAIAFGIALCNPTGTVQPAALNATSWLRLPMPCVRPD